MTDPIGRAEATDLAVLADIAHRAIDACNRPFPGHCASLDSGAAEQNLADAVHAGTGHVLRDGDGAVGPAVPDGDTPGPDDHRPRRHREGLGQALLAGCERRLRGPRLRLESFAPNEVANAFYRACGRSEGGPVPGRARPRWRSGSAVLPSPGEGWDYPGKA